MTYIWLASFILLFLCILYLSTRVPLKTPLETARSEGYDAGQHGLRKELEESREELKICKQEMEEIRELGKSMQAQLDKVQKYERRIEVKQDAFRMGIEDWFDLRRAELAGWRDEQLKALEVLKAEEKVPEPPEEIKKVDHNQLETTKIAGKERRTSGWTKFRGKKKETDKRNSAGLEEVKDN